MPALECCAVNSSPVILDQKKEPGNSSRRPAPALALEQLVDFRPLVDLRGTGGSVLHGLGDGCLCCTRPEGLRCFRGGLRTASGLGVRERSCCVSDDVTVALQRHLRFPHGVAGGVRLPALQLQLPGVGIGLEHPTPV